MSDDDLSIVPGPPAGDVNDDGQVDIADLIQKMKNFLVPTNGQFCKRQSMITRGY